MSDFKPNKAVITSIEEAVATSHSVYGSLRLAAQFASAELDLTQPCGAAVKEVRDHYSEYFQGDHNLRAVFSDFLTLHYAADAPLSIERKVDGAVQEVHTTGGEAVELPKHDMRKAAKAIREQEGEARASGGGRSARTTTNAPAQAIFASAKSAVENLLKSEAGVTALRELLRDNGYQLRKVAK